MSELTRDVIINMPAGREMNALVADRFLGYRRIKTPSSNWFVDRNWMGLADDIYWQDSLGISRADINGYRPFNPSTSWLDVKPVVDKLMELGDVFLEYWSDGEWFVSNGVVGYRDMEYSIKAHCDGKTTGVPSLPLAVCRAALLTTI